MDPIPAPPVGSRSLYRPGGTRKHILARPRPEGFRRGPAGLVIQGLDFFAEVPAMEGQMPPARGASGAVVILIVRDVQHRTSTAIRWLERYTRELKSNGGALMLADVNPSALDALKRTERWN